MIILSFSTEVHSYLMKEIGMIGSKLDDTPMDSNVKFKIKYDEDLVDKGRYQRLVGKLNIFCELCESIYSFSIRESHEGSLSHSKVPKGNSGKGFTYQKEC